MRKLPRHKKQASKSRRTSRSRRAAGHIGPNTTVYSASAWWRDSDPSMQVAALDRKVCEQKIEEMMLEEADRAYDDEMYDSRDEALDGIAWSGVHAFAVRDLTSSRNIDEAIRDLKGQGYFYPETP